MRHSRFLVGMSVVAAAFTGLITWQGDAIGESFFHTQDIASEAVFIPADFAAEHGETGEIVLKAGDTFPRLAREDLVGISFEIGWNSDQAEFLGASREGTVFAGETFQLETEHLASRSVAGISIWTGGQSGVIIRPGDELAKILFHVRENTRLGDSLSFPLTNVEIAYDATAPRSQTLTSVQGGVLSIGNPQGPEALPSLGNDFYFEESIIAKPGQERLIALRATDYINLGGFAFDMEFSSPHLVYLGYETQGTALERANFEILADASLPNHLGLMASTGRLGGAIVQPNDPLILLRFLVNPDAPIGTRVPLSIRKMQTVDAPTLELNDATVNAGTILVNPTSSLRVTGAFPLSSTSLKLTFSDLLVAADLDDVEITPPLKNNQTALQIDGNTVIIRDVNMMLPGQRYLVELAETVTGNITGSLASDYNFAFFRGFSAQYPSSGFTIESVQALSDTEAVIRFSDPINPESVENGDFVMQGLQVKQAVPDAADEKSVRLTTASQKSLTGSIYLTINNASKVHDITSAKGELLSLNVAPFTPFHLHTVGPKLLSAEAKKDDLLILEFNEPLLGSSISLDSFKVYERGKTQNLVTAASFFDLSPDHRTLTLRQVHTRAGAVYQLQVVPGKIRGNGLDGLFMGTANNLATFLGQGSFFTPWDFALESAEAIQPDRVRLGFSEAVSEELDPLDFAIWTLDNAGIARQLKIISAEANGAEVTLQTEVQQEDYSYFVLADSKKIESAYGEKLGVPDGQGFFGFSAGRMRAVAFEPREVEIGTSKEGKITGVHFPENVTVRAGTRWLEVLSHTPAELKVNISDDLALDTYDLVVVGSDGKESRLPHALTIIDPNVEAKMRPVVLSNESYASPYRVPNDGNTITTLWVRVADPRGVSDIDKVTADLRKLGGEASEKFTLHDFVDDKAWYKLEITVPATVPTSQTASEVPVTIQNKSGYRAFGTLEVMVSRDTEESIPPVIDSAVAIPDEVVPGDETEVIFQVEVSDEDGAGNVARVVVDASAVGLGLMVLTPPQEIEQDRACQRADYNLGEWSRCVNGRQRRSVELKPNLECIEDASQIPPVERECLESVCTRTDWEAAEWTECINGEQSREYRKKQDSTCFGEGEKPLPDKRVCTTPTPITTITPTATPTPTPTPTPTASPTAFLQKVRQFFIPSAFARTLFGNKIWFQSTARPIPNWVPEGSYALPVTAIDREGGEAKTTIALTIARNQSGQPHIDDDDIYVSPKNVAINDGFTEFQIFVKATDPNGHDDIVSVSLNLAEVGLPPVSMQKGQIEGAGAWYASPKLTIPRNVIPGFRELTVAVTDKDGNTDKEEFNFHVVTPDDSGKQPKIPKDRAYTNPRAFVAGGLAQGTLYVFVEEGAAPIAHVTANLGTILRYMPPQPTPVPTPAVDEFGNPVTPAPNAIPTATPAPTIFNPGDLPPPPPITKFLQDLVPIAKAQNPDPLALPGDPNGAPLPNVEGATPTAQMTPGASFPLPERSAGPVVPACNSTDTFVCMAPAIAEGSRGRWYYLPNLSVREYVQPGQHPYFISIVATDTDGRKAEAEVPVFVSDGILPLTEFDLPYLVAAVATGRHEVQAFFSSPLDLKRIRTDAFKITFFEDADTIMPIKNIEVRTDGRVVTLRTNPLMPEDRFTLFADAEQLGLKQSQQTSNAVQFDGYNINDAGTYFGIVSVRPLSSHSVEVMFRKKLRFSSILSNGGNFQIIEKGTSDPLPVRGAQVTADGQGVVLSTGTQRTGLTYLLVAKDIMDYTGRKLEKARSVKLFDAYYDKDAVRTLLNRADFNGDGRVDFLDFSIFSTVYGTNGTEIPDSSTSDFNGDGRVDFLDFTIFAQQYGAQIREEASQATPSPTPDNSFQFSFRRSFEQYVLNA